VLIALFTDIHGNRAFKPVCACVGATQSIASSSLATPCGLRRGPGFVVDTVRGFVDRGAVALLGNHDNAATGRASA
jgi:hypothetical protein